VVWNTQGMPAHVLRNRLILLHHFSEVFCPCIPMFDLEQSVMATTATSSSSSSVSQSDLLRALLVCSAKVNINSTR